MLLRPMAEPAVRRATYEDVLAAPSNVLAEVVGGMLHLQPRPSGAHCLITSVLGNELMTPFHRGRGGPGGWLIVDEPELHLGDDILVPDLAGWRRERLPKYPNTPFIALPPDWICEVLSPRTHQFDRIDKKAVYAREGVRFLWIIDPVERILEVSELVAGRWTDVCSVAGDRKVRAVPFDAIELDLGVLWEDMEPASG